MQAASQRSPAWADLQPELLLQVAGLLGNADRLSLMHTCGRWYAAIAAGPPHLVPAAVLACPPLELPQLSEEEGLWPMALADYFIRQANDNDTSNTLSMVSKAAALPPQTWRVRIEGEAQPFAAVMVVGVLPPGVRWLELSVTPCAGPLLPALARLRRLQRLTITGGCVDVQWAIGPATALAPLSELWLDCRRPPRSNSGGALDRSLVEQLPESVPHALAAATALHTFELRVSWSDQTALLCCALPSLRCLRIHIYYCTDEDAAAAVAALHQLTQLTGLTLGINCDEGSELDYDFPQGSDDWAHCVQLEPLAGLTALTELCLVELVELPPDFRQLSNLQRLSVTQGHSSGYEPLDWGSQPLTGLTALTRVEIVQGYSDTELPDPAVLASAPRLVEVHAPEAWSSQVAQVAHWRSQLAALRPDVRITPTLLPAPPAGEGQ